MKVLAVLTVLLVAGVNAQNPRFEQWLYATKHHHSAVVRLYSKSCDLAIASRDLYTRTYMDNPFEIRVKPTASPKDLRKMAKEAKEIAEQCERLAQRVEYLDKLR